MAEAEALLDRLALAYQQGFATIQVAAERAAQDAWFAMDSFSSDDEEAWQDAFWNVVIGSAVASSGVALAYIQQQIDAEGLDFTVPEPDLSWVEDDFDVWKSSPMVAARIAVSSGATPAEALVAGATRVADLTSAAVRHAEQLAIDGFLASIGEIEVEVDFSEVDSPEVGTTSPARAKRTKVQWRRVTQPGVCGWCRVAADRLYSGRAKKKHPLGAWHNYCRCTWRKVTEREAAQWEQRLAGGEWRTVIEERFSPEAASRGEANA